MPGMPASDLLAASCPQAAEQRAGLPFDASSRETERVLLTHALHCPTCQPIADILRRAHAARTRRLEEEAQAETEQAAIPVLDQTADVLEANGFHRNYLWDTVQARKGTPLEYCRVDVVGALAVVLHGSPTYAHTPAVRKVEALLVDRIPAPSLAAWYHHPGVTGRRVVALLRGTADELRARHHGQSATTGARAA